MFSPDTRFLVIDDFRTMRMIIKKSLQNMGFSQIEEADDGNNAFIVLQKALAGGKPIQCVVSDWNMPNMSGIELLRKVRADQNFKDIPFVLVTAENEQAQVIEAAKSGVSSYIVKPFTPADFQSKLGQVYKKHFGSKAA